MNYNGEEWKVYLPEKMQWGAVCIFTCGPCGFPGRFCGQDDESRFSEMGKQLDSLADVVSFGVAPGTDLYQMLRMAYAYEPDGLEIPLHNCLPALLVPAACGMEACQI